MTSEKIKMIEGHTFIQGPSCTKLFRHLGRDKMLTLCSAVRSKLLLLSFILECAFCATSLLHSPILCANYHIYVNFMALLYLLVNFDDVSVIFQFC